MSQQKILGFINCPINKMISLTLISSEYLAKNSNVLGKEAMIIYNKKLSVCPITTHIQIKNISKNLSKKIIYEKIVTINKFYLNYFHFKPKFVSWD